MSEVSGSIPVFPGMSEVSVSIPVSGLCFLLIFVVFSLCLPCYSSLLSACTVKSGARGTVKRGAPFTARTCQDYCFLSLLYLPCVYHVIYLC